MAMGSDQMADLDSIEAWAGERSASSDPADDLLHPDAPARFATQSNELSPSWTGAVDQRTWIRIKCQLRQTSPPWESRSAQAISHSLLCGVGYFLRS